jgi:DNA-binding PadR family transcriptional regulator
MDQEPELPLTEATLCILISLLPGPRHGYAIMQDVRALSGGRVMLSTGTLYGALKRLLEAGWIARDASDPDTPSGRAQKHYRLTEGGRRVFNAELARMQELLKIARTRAAEGGA